MPDSSTPVTFDTDTFFSTPLSSADPDVFAAIAKEQTRQQQQIELIASENIASQAVLEAQGTVLTNKYAEGYAGRRYYGGCEYVDIVEELAIERAKALFNCGFANVQPNSGSQANQAATVLRAPRLQAWTSARTDMLIRGTAGDALRSSATTCDFPFGPMQMRRDTFRPRPQPVSHGMVTGMRSRHVVAAKPALRWLRRQQ